mmetsp:Transcript_38701/g.86628  ORF Transcript_38701/g.86628 Transcript_38701/m.86628 type:complete len:223 (+) Transcript_38701:273-941(+)
MRCFTVYRFVLQQDANGQQPGTHPVWKEASQPHCRMASRKDFQPGKYPCLSICSNTSNVAANSTGSEGKPFSGGVPFRGSNLKRPFQGFQCGGPELRSGRSSEVQRSVGQDVQPAANQDAREQSSLRPSHRPGRGGDKRAISSFFGLLDPCNSWASGFQLGILLVPSRGHAGRVEGFCGQAGCYRACRHHSCAGLWKLCCFADTERSPGALWANTCLQARRL